MSEGNARNMNLAKKKKEGTVKEWKVSVAEEVPRQ